MNLLTENLPLIVKHFLKVLSKFLGLYHEKKIFVEIFYSNLFSFILFVFLNFPTPPPHRKKNLQNLYCYDVIPFTRTTLSSPSVRLINLTTRKFVFFSFFSTKLVMFFSKLSSKRKPGQVLCHRLYISDVKSRIPTGNKLYLSKKKKKKNIIQKYSNSDLVQKTRLENNKHACVNQILKIKVFYFYKSAPRFFPIRSFYFYSVHCVAAFLVFNVRQKRRRKKRKKKVKKKGRSVNKSKSNIIWSWQPVNHWFEGKNSDIIVFSVYFNI